MADSLNPENIVDLSWTFDPKPMSKEIPEPKEIYQTIKPEVQRDSYY
jgi:hypothetical protein